MMPGVARPSGRLLPLLGGILIPAVLTVASADGTRVFVGVSAAVGTALAITFLGLNGESDMLETDAAPRTQLPPISPLVWLMALWLAALLLMPVVRTDAGANRFILRWAIAVDLAIGH